MLLHLHVSSVIKGITGECWATLEPCPAVSPVNDKNYMLRLFQVLTFHALEMKI
jgi:hypothetical protein